MLLNRWGNRPVHLFVFTRQHLVWRYCTADRDLEINGNTYLSAQIERGEIKQTVERAKDKLGIKFAYLLDPTAPEYPATQVLGDNWWPYIPTDTVNVVCLEYDAGTGAAPAVQWMGEVTQPKFSDVEMELICEPNNGFARARNQGPKWQRGCWKTVYSTGPRGCNLSKVGGVASGVVTKIEAALGDVPPRAHLLVPEFGQFLSSLEGRSVTWIVGGIERSSVVLDAYYAYDERIKISMPGEEVDTTTFFWNDVGSKVDHVRPTGPFGAFPAYFYYTRRAALVLADATGLAVGSQISIDLPRVGVIGHVTAVNGLALTAAEFAESTFALAGGYLTFLSLGGLLVRREIAAHNVGDAILQLQAGGPVPAVGAAVTALPTCARTWSACEVRMNTGNFGGSLYKPAKNPMDGVSMSWG